MSNAAAIESAISTVYLSRKVGVGGYDKASKAWDTLRKTPNDHLTIWTFAVLAERDDRATWGVFRALVESWLLEVTAATFAFPTVP